MSYRVLARKYRPQNFEEIMGQAHVATTLTNALKSQTVAHAYLFSGPRGVGKTTTARVLAKALNCAQGPTARPCNQCDFCQRIARGQEIVDVMEIDAASNRGIDEIRELRESVVYAPAHARYKVYIIDEAHQITHDAFNAFLKTLEEPPSHAVFILATTEHQRIPATILSRCQFFRFKRLSTEDISAQMERILAQEKIKVDPAAVARLARAAGGSVRDALSLLDQALAYVGPGPASAGGLAPLSVQQVELLLGFLPEEFLRGFAASLLTKEPSGVLEWVKRLTDEGWDLPQFVRDFREFLRETIVDQLASGARADALKLSDKMISLPEILQWIKVMGQAQDDMRWNDNARLVLELYALRLTQPFVDAGELLRRIQELEKSEVPSPVRRMGEGQDEGSMPSPQPSPTLRAGEGTGTAPMAPAQKTVGAEDRHDIKDSAAQWKQVLAELWKRPLVGSQMERARLQSAGAREWVIAFPDKFAVDMVQRSEALIRETITKVTGAPIAVRFVQLAAPAPEMDVVVTPSPGERGDERQPAVLKDTGVQKVLQTFKGRIRAESTED